MVEQKQTDNTRRDDDLYAQIAAGDQEVIQTKHKNSLIMSLMISYMRLTLSLDEKKRQFQGVFRVLSRIWMTFMGLLYLCGLVMFAILLGSYFRFPTYVEEYLDRIGILYAKKEIPGYIFSQVNLYGLHDKANMYKIDKVSVSSTFADFLNKRAKNLSLSGVKVSIPTVFKKGEDVLSKLSRLNNFASYGAGVRIDSLEVADAKLSIKGKSFEIPVSFSLTGIYGKETNISAFLSINEPYLKLSGPLTIQRKNGRMKWDLIIQAGQISLPNRPTESLSGTVSFETNNGEVLSATSKLNLKYETQQKEVSLNLKRVSSSFKGTLGLKWIDASNADKPVDRTSIEIDFDKTKIDPTGQVETTEPLQVRITSSYIPNVTAEGLTVKLPGKLTCQLFENCTFQLIRTATGSIKNIQLPIQGNRLQNTSSVSLKLKPLKDMFDISFKDGESHLKLDLGRFSISGKIVDTKENFTLIIGRLNLDNKFNIWDKKVNSNIELKDITYQTPTQEMFQGQLSISNLTEADEQIVLKSPKVVLKDSAYLNVPFALDITQQANQTKAKVSFEREKAQILFEGYLNLNAGIVNGILIVPPIQLEKLPQPLNRISSLIPTDLKSVSGELAGYGYLSGNTRSGITGPFYLALSHMGIKTDNLSIQNLNTMLTLTSLMPLVSETSQGVYIGRIDSFFPITDVRFNIQLGNRFAQLSNLQAMMFGIPLVSEEILMPYRDIATLIYLKNQNYDLSDIVKNLSFKDWQILGASQGNILFPLEMKDFIIKLKSTSVQLMNTTLKYTGENKPSFMGNDTQVVIRSGNITVDRDEENPETVKASFVMDVELLPSHLKKTIRDTYSGRIPEIMEINLAKKGIEPLGIMENVQKIKRETKQFLGK